MNKQPLLEGKEKEKKKEKKEEKERKETPPHAVVDSFSFKSVLLFCFVFVLFSGMSNEREKKNKF
jgi:hypothetical protein